MTSALDPDLPELEAANLLKISDRIERAKRAGALLDAYQAAVAEISRIRRDTFEDLASEGLSHGEIAKRVGNLTRTRVGQILNSGPRPERGFLGMGQTITVAVGGKHEANRRDSKPHVMVSKGAMAAAGQLTKLAESLGFATNEVEVVAPPGHVNLNRAGLVVLCAPRLLPFVGQMLDSDPRYGFGHDDNGWHLIDRTTSHVYRSPADSGHPSDYAYIGRLPRPDGKGTFLYLAGIHSLGTRGAATYVETHLEDLWAQTKGRRFSTLVECHADPTSAGDVITEVEPIADLHRHEGGT